MRILGLDIGTKRTGIAVSDPFGWTAQGVEVWKHVSREKDLDRIVYWLSQYETNMVVVGMPKNMDGTKGERALWTEKYVTDLQEKVPDLRAIFWDERLSTVMAEKGLIEGNVRRDKRKTVIDKMAAVIILQGYLDSITSQKERV